MGAEERLKNVGKNLPLSLKTPNWPSFLLFDCDIDLPTAMTENPDDVGRRPMISTPI